MEIDIFQVDAFAEQVFKGNPAAVCPLYQGVNDEAGMFNRLGYSKKISHLYKIALHQMVILQRKLMLLAQVA
jgi:hypothetical protein